MGFLLAHSTSSSCTSHSAPVGRARNRTEGWDDVRPPCSARHRLDHSVRRLPAAYWLSLGSFLQADYVSSELRTRCCSSAYVTSARSCSRLKRDVMPCMRSKTSREIVELWWFSDATAAGIASNFRWQNALSCIAASSSVGKMSLKSDRISWSHSASDRGVGWPFAQEPDHAIPLPSDCRKRASSSRDGRARLASPTGARASPPESESLAVDSGVRSAAIHSPKASTRSILLRMLEAFVSIHGDDERAASLSKLSSRAPSRRSRRHIRLIL